MTVKNTTELLPWFADSFFFGEPGTVVSFYVKDGIAKSGHFVHGDWIDDILSAEQLARMPQKGFPLSGMDVFPIDRVPTHDLVHLIFLKKVDPETARKTLIFWKALTFISSGNFLSKHRFLENYKDSSLSGRDLDSLNRLQMFFSYRTTYGEEACNMLFDAERDVIILRGTVGGDILGEDLNYPDQPDVDADLRNFIALLLK
jgi:hypothetical protein